MAPKDHRLPHSRSRVLFRSPFHAVQRGRQPRQQVPRSRTIRVRGGELTLCAKDGPGRRGQTRFKLCRRRVMLGPCVAQAQSAVSLISFFCHFSDAGLGCGQLVVADYCAGAYPERKVFMTRLEIMADYFLQVYVCDPAFHEDWSTLWTDQTVDNRIVALPIRSCSEQAGTCRSRLMWSFTKCNRI